MAKGGVRPLPGVAESVGFFRRMHTRKGGWLAASVRQTPKPQDGGELDSPRYVARNVAPRFDGTLWGYVDIRRSL